MVKVVVEAILSVTGAVWYSLVGCTEVLCVVRRATNAAGGGFVEGACSGRGVRVAVAVGALGFVAGVNGADCLYDDAPVCFDSVP